MTPEKFPAAFAAICCRWCWTVWPPPRVKPPYVPIWPPARMPRGVAGRMRGYAFPAPDTLPDDANSVQTAAARSRLAGTGSGGGAALLRCLPTRSTATPSAARGRSNGPSAMLSVFPARPLPRRRAAGIPTISIILSRCNPTKALIPIYSGDAQWCGWMTTAPPTLRPTA